MDELIKESAKIVLVNKGISMFNFQQLAMKAMSHNVDLATCKGIVEDLWGVEIPEGSLKEEDFQAYDMEMEMDGGDDEEQPQIEECPERLKNEVLKASILRHLTQAISTYHMTQVHNYFMGDDAKMLEDGHQAFLFPYLKGMIQRMPPVPIANMKVERNDEGSISSIKVILKEEQEEKKGDRTPVIKVNAPCTILMVHEISKGVAEIYTSLQHLITLSREDAEIVNKFSNTPKEEMYHIGSGVAVFKKFTAIEEKWTDKLVELAKMDVVDFLTYMVEEHPYLLIGKYNDTIHDNTE